MATSPISFPGPAPTGSPRFINCPWVSQILNFPNLFFRSSYFQHFKFRFSIWRNSECSVCEHRIVDVPISQSSFKLPKCDVWIQVYGFSIYEWGFSDGRVFESSMFQDLIFEFTVSRNANFRSTNLSVFNFSNFWMSMFVRACEFPLYESRITFLSYLLKLRF